MKKIFIGLAVLAIASCSYLKGDYTLGSRNTFNDFFYTYNIRYYNQDALNDMDEETEVINNYKIGVMRHAVPGGLVASSQVLEKQIYSSEYLRPNKKGALVSYTVPVPFSDEEVYKTIGEVKINGDTYRLIEPNRLGDVLLISDDGDIYPRVGKIYNNRLALLKTSFILEPRDVKFIDEIENNVASQNTVSGFEIRYVGLEGYQLVFKYNSFYPDGKTKLEAEKTFKFPMYDKNVLIEGVSIEIFEVTEGGIEYKILSI